MASNRKYKDIAAAATNRKGMSRDDYNHTVDSFLAEDGLRIFYQSWRVRDPKAIVLICHGIGEHCGRYTNLIDALRGRAVSIYGSDHRGSGQSEGKRGHVDDFSKYFRDIKKFAEEVVKRENPNIPIFLLGHSLGGLIAEHYALNYPEDLCGLVLSAPAILQTVPVAVWKKVLSKMFSNVLPQFTVNNGIDPRLISSDQTVVENYLNDPLVHDRVSIRFFREYAKFARRGAVMASKLTMPILLVHGDQDRIVCVKSSEIIFNAARSEDKQLEVFRGLYHEVMNETIEARQKVLRTVVDWIARRIV